MNQSEGELCFSYVVNIEDGIKVNKGKRKQRKEKDFAR